MGRSLHVRDTAVYPTIEDNLCFVCRGKPDKGQEDLNSCCYDPNNAFITVRCVTVSQQL